jgi:hypothetical protein
VARKFCLAALLMAISAAASAQDKCVHILWFELCAPVNNPEPVRAPEIDPASAFAGFTMLAGGLAVLRGRRSKQAKG